MSNTKFLVSWIDGDDLGFYAATDADAAILAAVKDAGYESLERAKDFIYDEKGEITIQAVPSQIAKQYIGGRFTSTPEDNFYSDGVEVEVVGDDGEYTTFEFKDGSQCKINADGEIFEA